MCSFTFEAAYTGGFFIFYDISRREFPNFEIGENIITWEGIVTEIKISSKSRWL
jgi:phage-related protein